MKNNTWFESVEDVERPTVVQRVFNKFSPMVRRVLSKTIWLLSTARNAVVVVICIGIAMAVEDNKIPDDPRDGTFVLTGDIDGDVPPFEPPPFSTNSTSGEAVDFMGMLQELNTGLIILPLIAILENVAIAKSFCKRA